jgi:hypothetical protein
MGGHTHIPWVATTHQGTSVLYIGLMCVWHNLFFAIHYSKPYVFHLGIFSLICGLVVAGGHFHFSEFG